MALAMDAQTRREALHSATVGKVDPRRVFWARVLLVGGLECRQLPFRPEPQDNPEKDVVFRERQENDRRRLQPEIKTLPDGDSRQDVQLGNRFWPPESRLVGGERH